MNVKIVKTGVANVASVSAAFSRLGCEAALTESVAAVTTADALVLPGVGSFGAGMESLQERGMVDALRTRIAEGRPTLAICLGLQLLAETSEESPGVRGLGCLPLAVGSFPATVARPQFGWNWLANENAPVLGEGGYVYYANSYRLTNAPTGWQSGWSNHGEAFIGCLQKGAVVACQFHPELSGPYGSQVLGRWLDTARSTTC